MALHARRLETEVVKYAVEAWLKNCGVKHSELKSIRK